MYIPQASNWTRDAKCGWGLHFSDFHLFSTQMHARNINKESHLSSTGHCPHMCKSWESCVAIIFDNPQFSEITHCLAELEQITQVHASSCYFVPVHKSMSHTMFLYAIKIENNTPNEAIVLEWVVTNKTLTLWKSGGMVNCMLSEKCCFMWNYHKTFMQFWS